jgi:two-component system alkaline phosphatase synthesis response regulator PhoP
MAWKATGFISGAMDSAARILIVDDDTNLSLMIARFLGGPGGYRVQVVNQPEEAMDAARGFRPDLILLDWDMPGMRGEEVLSELRRCDQTASTRVAFFSGTLQSSSETTGRTWFLPKPIALNRLLSNVQAILL